MDGEIDCCAVLGIIRSADDAIIQAIFRVLAKRYHPDVAVGNKSPGSGKFRLIKEAYDTLSDPTGTAPFGGRRPRRRRHIIQ